MPTGVGRSLFVIAVNSFATLRTLSGFLVLSVAAVMLVREQLRAVM